VVISAPAALTLKQLALLSVDSLASRSTTVNGRAAEIEKLEAKGFGLCAIARQLKMPPSSFHKALRVAA
jgi:hypothetical protein